MSKNFATTMNTIVVARQTLANARKEAQKGLIDYLRENGPCAVRDIAEATGIPSRAVQGIVCNARNEYKIMPRGSKKFSTLYAKINADGTVDMDKTIAISYRANLYVVRER